VTKLRLRYVHRYRDTRGKVRHYFRRPGVPRIPLPGLPGSAEFMEAYQLALAGAAPLPEVGQARTKPGSLSALIVSYYRSAEFAGLAASTRRTRRAILEAFRGQHGDKPVKGLQRQHVRRILADRAATPHAANNLFKILRLLMRFAILEGWRDDDPTLGEKGIRTRSDGFHTWTDAEIAAFEAHHAIGTRERLALALLLYTAQRRSDVVGMGRQDMRGGRLYVRQVKTRARLAIPVHPELASVLASTPSGNLPFLVTAHGKPFTAAGFGNWFGDACRAAGLPKGCSAHGLRKAAARRLAEAGCSTHEIMAITGHKSLSEVARYTTAASQEHLADRAMDRITGAEPERRLANSGTPLANSGAKSLNRKE